MTRRTLLSLAAAAAQAQSAPERIGTRMEPMFDAHMIERFTGGARLRLHPPQRREIALVHDAPWEGSGTGYHRVFRDGAKFRMYYKAWNLVNPAKPSKLHIAYAESADGVKWTKPDLGLVAFAGARKNNIILSEIHGGVAHDFSPFVDANPAAPRKSRMKAVGYGKPTGLYAFESEDGIEWRLMRDQAIITDGRFDTQNIAFWDSLRGQYRCYYRDFEGDRRRIKVAESDDFLTWTKGEWLTYPGSPDEQLYTNQVEPYYRAPHVLVGFPARYTDRGWTGSTDLLPGAAERKQRSAVSQRYGTAVTDSLFMTSRDGRVFHRWDEAFLRPGLRTAHNWAYGDNYFASGMIETRPETDDEGPELSMFATESYFTGNDSRLRRYALRIDGFASAFAPLGGGEVVTKPLVFEGGALHVNLATSAGGSVRVGVEAVGGGGLALEQSDVHFGDSLDQRIRWKQGSLGEWAGRPVRLRFELRDADLYSFQFRRG